jgi:capsular polysaccharide biosynthesis protein
LLTPWEAVKLPSLVNATFALLIAVLLAGLAAGYVRTREPLYRSTATILLDHPDVAREPTPAPIQRLNALRRKYAALAPTKEIAGRVGEKLNLPQSTVARTIEVEITTDSLVMYATATAKSSRAAPALAQALAEELVAYATREQDQAKVAPDNRVTLRIVDDASEGAKISPTGNDMLTAAASAGVVGLAVAYVLLQLLTAGRRAGQP